MLIQNELAADRDLREIPEIESVVLEDDRKDYGRTPGANNIPQFLRNTIAIAATKDTNKNVARAFGVSAQEVSLLKNAKLPDSKDDHGKDKVNPHSTANEALREATGKDLERVRSEATSKLLMALDSITKERVNMMPKLTEVASFAESMSRIIERTSGRDGGGLSGEAKFVFIVPESRKVVADYKVIEVENSLD